MSPTASPSPTKTAPLSNFENDPAVMALRAWAAQVARTVNTGHYADTAVTALMTPPEAKNMKAIAGDEVGHQYPGPLPFTPTSVRVASSTVREVHLCVVTDGYSLNPATHKPFKARAVSAIDAGAQLVEGRWLVSKFAAGTFSCAGVKVPEPSF